MTPITKSQIEALNLGPEATENIIRIFQEAEDAKEKRARIDPAYFERFWCQYPKRKGANPKATAKLKFEAAVRGGALPESIIAAVMAYAKEEAGKAGTEFIPMASTWLNQQRYNDYAPAPVQEYQAMDETSLDPRWSAVRVSLANEMGQDVFRSWIDRLKLVDISETSVTLEAPTRFLRSYIESRYLSPLTRAWKSKGISNVNLTVG